jgi:thymidylate synthase ThyX
MQVNIMNKTNRPISEGAELELNKIYPVLDHGEVELVDYLGNDSTVARSARTSYQGSEGKTPDDDQRLITRLWKDKHTFFGKINAIMARH